MQHCVSLKCITCPFDPFICCNMVADIIIFIPLDNYSTILSRSLTCALDHDGLFTVNISVCSVASFMCDSLRPCGL